MPRPIGRLLIPHYISCTVCCRDARYDRVQHGRRLAGWGAVYGVCGANEAMADLLSRPAAVSPACFIAYALLFGAPRLSKYHASHVIEMRRRFYCGFARRLSVSERCNDHHRDVNIGVADVLVFIQLCPRRQCA